MGNDVPPYSELGKNARNIFMASYPFGLVKLAFKTKTEKSLEVGTDFIMDLDGAKSDGSMESKYKTKEYGTLTERWTTDGNITTEYSLEDKPSTGFGISTAFNFRPVDSVKSMSLGLSYKNDSFNIGTTIANAFNSNVQILGTIVTGFKELLIGLESGYDTASGRMTKANVGLAFGIEDIEFHMTCNDVPNEYGASIFHKLNSQWDGALNGILSTNSESNEYRWTVGVGTSYKFEEGSIIRLKIDKDLQLGTSIEKKIRDGIKITIAMSLDCSNPSGSEHKVGMALELEA